VLGWHVRGVLGQAPGDVVAKRFGVAPRARRADDRELVVEPPGRAQRRERREQKPLGEVPGRAEDEKVARRGDEQLVQSRAAERAGAHLARRDLITASSSPSGV
jgi:hypothetical protein